MNDMKATTEMLEESLKYVMKEYSEMVDTLLLENERLREELRKKANQ